MTALPVAPPPIPALADRGGTQLKTPRSVLLVDTREQQPFDFSRFQHWFAGVEREPFTWETTPSPEWKTSAWWSARTSPI